MEPMAALAEVDLSGRITMWTGTQIPNMMRMTYAKALGISPDNIRIIVPDYGGAFGAKMENNIHLVAAALAQKARKPVKLVNTRYDDFIAGNPRVPMVIDIKLGATKEGILTGKEVQVMEPPVPGWCIPRLLLPRPATVSTRCTVLNMCVQKVIPFIRIRYPRPVSAVLATRR